MSSIQGKIAVVTGGGRGIGREIALYLAREGCDVAIVARTEAQVEQVAGEVRQIGRESLAVACDLANGEAIAQAYAKIVRELGPIDIVVNNAGVVTPLGPTHKVDPAQWTQNIEINLVSAFRWLHLCLPHMLEQRWGRIVSTSTGAAGGTGMMNANAYSTSKAGLEMLTLNLAEEYKSTGVTINAVRPGTVDTEMQTFIRTQPEAAVGSEIHTRFNAFYHEGRLHSAELPARLTVNLLKGESNGEIVNIYSERGQELIQAITE